MSPSTERCSANLPQPNGCRGFILSLFRVEQKPRAKEGSTLTILSLDLGTTTGWATRKDGQVQSGIVTFRPGRFEGGGMRYLKFSKWLESMLFLGGVEAVYFEEVRGHKGVDAAHIYGGLMATLSAFCESREIPYQGIPVGTVKKHATGKGNANKDKMIEAMQALGHAPVDDNEADAIALLLCVEAGDRL